MGQITKVLGVESRFPPPGPPAVIPWRAWPPSSSGRRRPTQRRVYHPKPFLRASQGFGPAAADRGFGPCPSGRLQVFLAAAGSIESLEVPGPALVSSWRRAHRPRPGPLLGTFQWPSRALRWDRRGLDATPDQIWKQDGNLGRLSLLAVGGGKLGSTFLEGGGPSYPVEQGPPF